MLWGVSPPAIHSLIGFWESEATSQGGIGHTLELKADGKLVTSFTMMVDGVYRATAGSLFIAENAKALAETTNGTRFTITQNLFALTDGDGQDRLARRVVKYLERTSSPQRLRQNSSRLRMSRDLFYGDGASCTRRDRGSLRLHHFFALRTHDGT